MKKMNREERKQKEYHMAVMRTIWNTINGLVAVISLLFTLLIYHRVYFSGH